MKAVPAFLLALGLSQFPVRAETIQAVLARMDKEAASFRQMTAKLTKSTFTAVLNDTSRESGTVWMKRSGRNVAVRAEMTGQDPRAIGLEDGKAKIYYPKINTVQIYDLGKERGLVDQFLALGFGSSGKDLATNYTVRAAGEEELNGQKTTRLDLFPKSQKVLEQVKKVELWIPLDAGHPVQERVLQPGDNFYLFTYTDVEINPNLPDSDFRLNLPPGVKKDYPQKP